MTARERIANLWDRSVPVAPLLDAHEAEVTAAAYRETADIAEMAAIGFFDNAETEQGNGAMAVAARLRARADQMGQQ